MLYKDTPMLTNRKLNDQIKAIERSGQADGRSKEYIMRTIISNASKHSEEPMDITKKSIQLDPNDHKTIEDLITKVAGENNINDVLFVTMNLTHNDCIVKFSCSSSFIPRKSSKGRRKCKVGHGQQTNGPFSPVCSRRNMKNSLRVYMLTEIRCGNYPQLWQDKLLLRIKIY